MPCFFQGHSRGNEQCKFPFKYGGKVFHSCTKFNVKGGEFPDFWCSTQTDRNNNHQKGKWGDCNMQTCRQERTSNTDKNGRLCFTVSHPHHVICHYIIELCIINQFQVSGPSRGICKFPFEHNGKIYEECTTEGLPSDVRKGPWCPTDVDETGTVNLGKRRHGHCRCLGSPRQIQ